MFNHDIYIYTVFQYEQASLADLTEYVKQLGQRLVESEQRIAASEDRLHKTERQLEKTKERLEKFENRLISCEAQFACHYEISNVISEDPLPVFISFGCEGQALSLYCPENRTIFVVDAHYGVYYIPCGSSCCPPNLEHDCTQKVNETS